jgi:hypothetical protein
MEYVKDHGTFADIPFDRIIDSWKALYGAERIRQWIDAFEKSGGKRYRKLENEDWVR